MGSSAAAASPQIVTVLGGTGFLGRRIVKRLLARGLRVRAASRHPEKARTPVAGEDGPAEPVRADILDEASIAKAVAGSDAVVNAVSLYVERAEQTFERVHVVAAATLAGIAREACVGRFIQISGIGANPASDSPYIRARGRGEAAVRDAFPGALIARSAVMIGPNDAFLAAMMRMVRLLPVCPLFGNGDTRLQPVFVDDVADGVGQLAVGRNGDGSVFEFAGPRVYTYRELLRQMAAGIDKRIGLVPVPFVLWDVLAFAAELLPAAPITRNQIDLMRIDTIAAAGLPGLRDLGVEPRDLHEVMQLVRNGG